MICRHNLYHFTVANTRFTAPLTRRGKTKFATVKYNLCLQIIESQTCYLLIYKLAWLAAIHVGKYQKNLLKTSCNVTPATKVAHIF